MATKASARNERARVQATSSNGPGHQIRFKICQCSIRKCAFAAKRNSPRRQRWTAAKPHCHRNDSQRSDVIIATVRINKGKKPTVKYLPAPRPDESVDAKLTKESVSGLCPPGCVIRKDYYNGRWIFYWRFQGPPAGPWRSISRSWSERSVRDCVIQCLRAAWTWAMAEGIECTCPNLWTLEYNPE